MKKHTKIYMDFFGFKIPEDVPCEICKRPAIDIHHIDARGMGGSATKDNIENLMAVCRECHDKYGDKKQHKIMLKLKHYDYIKMHGK